VTSIAFAFASVSWPEMPEAANQDQAGNSPTAQMHSMPALDCGETYEFEAWPATDGWDRCVNAW
jgi:hypothetical protein